MIRFPKQRNIKNIKSLLIEAISKPRISFESKAQTDKKRGIHLEYVSILKRLVTQLSHLKPGPEMASNNFLISRMHELAIKSGFAF